MIGADQVIDGVEDQDDYNAQIKMPEVPDYMQKMVVVSTDNASNITKAVADSSMIHLRCFAHTMNLAVQKFVKAIDEHLSRVRALARFFHNSPGATATLKVSLILD